MMRDSVHPFTVNGATVLHAARPWGESVVCQAFLPAGCRVEALNERGLCHLLEHLLFRGTRRHASTRALMQAFEACGSVTCAHTSRDYLTIGFQAEPAAFDDAMPLLLDVLQEPVFDEQAFEQEKETIRSELLARADDPHTSCKERLRRALWGDHPLGRPVGGTPETVSALAYSRAGALLGAATAPGALLFTVVGNVEQPAVAEALGLRLRPRPGETFGIDIRDVAPLPRCALVPRNLETTFVALGFRILPPTPSALFGWEVLSTALARGDSSILFQELRQERLLAYTIYSQVSFFRDGMEFVVFLNVAPHKTLTALREVLACLERARELSDETVAIARRRTRAEWRFRLEAPLEYALWLGQVYMAYGRFSSVSEIAACISSVAPPAVRELAVHLADRSGIAMAVVGRHSEAEVRGWLDALDVNLPVETRADPR